MDYIKLNQTAKDQLHPALSSLMLNLKNVSSLPLDFDGRKKVLSW